ncbi:hypothetical protein DFS34DRAFT_629615 [Phlyctochytrium arcticum]|nr:hypothetical protein DFS34DRAFT_629615 [Phlyctochytrium arcticum]
MLHYSYENCYTDYFLIYRKLSKAVATDTTLKVTIIVPRFPTGMADMLAPLGSKVLPGAAVDLGAAVPGAAVAFGAAVPGRAVAFGAAVPGAAVAFGAAVPVALGAPSGGGATVPFPAAAVVLGAPSGGGVMGPLPAAAVVVPLGSPAGGRVGALGSPVGEGNSSQYGRSSSSSSSSPVRFGGKGVFGGPTGGVGVFGGPTGGVGVFAGPTGVGGGGGAAGSSMSSMSSTSSRWPSLWTKRPSDRFTSPWKASGDAAAHEATKASVPKRIDGTRMFVKSGRCCSSGICTAPIPFCD